MKSIFLLLVGCFCLHALNAQKIQLHEGDEFTYRTSDYQLKKTLTEDGSVKQTSESIYVYQIHFKVNEVLKERYKLSARYEILNKYGRSINAGDEQW